MVLLMSTQKKMSRRVFLVRSSAVGVALGAGLAAVGCGGEEALNCSASASGDQRTAQSNLGYVEASPHGTAKNCTNCNFFTTAGANACGSCTLLAGSQINPNGYCNSWAARG